MTAAERSAAVLLEQQTAKINVGHADEGYRNEQFCTTCYAPAVRAAQIGDRPGSPSGAWTCSVDPDHTTAQEPSAFETWPPA